MGYLHTDSQIPTNPTYLSHERESVGNNIINNYITKPVWESPEDVPVKIESFFVQKYIKYIKKYRNTA